MTDSYAATAGPADVESALDGVCDAGRAAASAVVGYLEGSHTFALDEVDGVGVSHLRAGWSPGRSAPSPTRGPSGGPGRVCGRSS